MFSMLWNFWNLWIYPLLAPYLVIMIPFWNTYVFQNTFGISSLTCQGEKYQNEWVKLCCSNNPYISDALNNKSWFLTHTANYGWASVTLCQLIGPQGHCLLNCHPLQCCCGTLLTMTLLNWKYYTMFGENGLYDTVT